jgi:glycosyltransferase involved in cell wall biosynthesis
MSETRSPVKRGLKKLLLPTLFRLIDGFLAIGTLNREYYVHYGVPHHKIFMMPYAVDNAFFQNRAREARMCREQLRAELGLEPGRPVILYASKLQRRKRPGDLLEAYVKLSPNGTMEPRPYLLFVGDGEERHRLEQRVRGLGWRSILFLGFKNQSELPRYYDLCDVFVLPSEREQWGLVVNEAMNAARPVVVSDQVGCAPDLVRDGLNGFVFPVGDVAALAERLRRLTEEPELARQMGEESLRIIEKWSFDADIAGLLEALDRVTKVR